MIDKIIYWIKNLLFKEEKDPHLEYYEDVPESDIKVIDVRCTTHYPRYKKSCTVCRGAGAK